MTEIWDPLWEYVLEDYDSDEETRLGMWRRHRQQRQLQRTQERQQRRKERLQEKQIQKERRRLARVSKNDRKNDSLYHSGGGLVSWESWRSTKSGHRRGASRLMDSRQDDSYDYNETDFDDNDDDDDDDDDESSTDDDDDEGSLIPSLDLTALYPDFFNTTTSHNEQDQKRKQQKQKRALWRRDSSRSQKQNIGTSNNTTGNDLVDFWNIDFFDVRDDTNEDARTSTKKSTIPAAVDKSASSTTTSVLLHTPPRREVKPKKGILRRTSFNNNTETGTGTSYRAASSNSERNIDTSKCINTKNISKSVENGNHSSKWTFDRHSGGDNDDLSEDVHDNDDDRDDGNSLVIVGARTYMTGEINPFGRKREIGENVERSSRCSLSGRTSSLPQVPSSSLPSPSHSKNQSLSTYYQDIESSNSFSRRGIFGLKRSNSKNLSQMVAVIRQEQPEATITEFDDDDDGGGDASGGDGFWNVMPGPPTHSPISRTSEKKDYRPAAELTENVSSSRQVTDVKTTHSHSVHSASRPKDKAQTKNKRFLLRRQFRMARNALRINQSRRSRPKVVQSADTFASCDRKIDAENNNVVARTGETKTDGIDSPSEIQSANLQRVGARHLVADEDSSSKSQGTSAKNRGKSARRCAIPVDEDDFDPLMMFLEVAEKLDPWGDGTSDEDSNSDTSDSEEGEDDSVPSSTKSNEISSSPLDDDSSSQADETDSFNNQLRPKSGNLNSLLDQKLPNMKQPTTTEIRLRINPIGDTLSEEVIRSNSNGNDRSNSNTVKSFPEGDGNINLFAESSQASRDNSSNAEASLVSSVSRASVQETSKRRPSLAGSTESKMSELGVQSATHQAEITTPATMRRDGTIERKKYPSDEIKIPLDLRIERPIERLIAIGSFSVKNRVVDSTEKAASIHRGVWKRLVCCSAAEKDEASIQSNKIGNASQNFPVAAMIVNGQSQIIPGMPLEAAHGIDTFPQEQVSQRGPHSLYSYDYDSHEHIDVSYKEFGQRARTSLAVRHLGEPPILTENTVVVKVEASTISETDCIVRQGDWWGHDAVPLPNTPGVDVVGKIIDNNETIHGKYDLHPGQTVVSLVKWGGNSRYISINPDQLVKVQDGLDPAEVACIPETYLAAFQVLHIGQSVKRRYKENSLKGKTVLIIGSMANNMGMAIIELAIHAGAASIYATAKKKHWEKLVEHGIMPLSQDPMDWIQRVEGSIDLVLAPNGSYREDVSPVHFRALRPHHGQLVLGGRRVVGNDIPIKDWKSGQNQLILSCNKNKALTRILNKSHSYDVYEEWHHNLELCKKDVRHLLSLLEDGKIKPKVLDRIELGKVGKAQEVLESKRVPGFLVCEPWMHGKQRAVYL